MPTDEQFIELLREIKDHCAPYEKCEVCKFLNRQYRSCQIADLAEYLSDYPTNWNMEEIERIIRL